MRYLLLFGDVHGEWEHMDLIVSKVSKRYGLPEGIIQVGDYGVGPWPNDKCLVGAHPWAATIPHIVLPGNHENYVTLEKYWAGELRLPICVARRPEVIKMAGLTFLCIGGADSLDYRSRVEGESWWRGEIISPKVIDEAKDLLNTNVVDVVLTHCAPHGWLSNLRDVYKLSGKLDVPSSVALQRIVDFLVYSPPPSLPKLWIFGHYHSLQVMDHMEVIPQVVGLPICSEHMIQSQRGFALLDLDSGVLTVDQQIYSNRQPWLKGKATSNKLTVIKTLCLKD